MSPENTLLVAHCQEEGGGLYSDYTEMPDGSLACILRLMYTYAIVSGLNHYGHEDRWCYSSYEKASEALETWKDNFANQEEPTGWHRHPATGRRVDEKGVVTINF